MPNLTDALDDATVHVPSPIENDLPSRPQPIKGGGGEFTVGLDSPNIVGTGLNGGQFSFSIGDAVFIAPQEGTLNFLLA